MSAVAPVLDSLTATQERVLALTANGYTVSAIAHRLGISERTAKHHREDIVRRLDAANIVHAVALYVEARARQRRRRIAPAGQLGLDW